MVAALDMGNEIPGRQSLANQLAYLLPFLFFLWRGGLSSELKRRPWLLFALGGDCHSAVAALARMEGERVHLRAMLYSEDGADHVAGEARFTPGDAQGPAGLAAELLARAPETITRLFKAG